MSKALRGLGVLAAAMLPLMSGIPVAAAIPPPVIDPNVPPPADGPPGPEIPMEQRNYCQVSILQPGTDPHAVSEAQRFMQLPQLWETVGKGAGVSVALIDTGVTPSARLPHLHGGGDYVTGGDGLSDCDAHGTSVAAVIAGAPAEDDAFSGVAPDAEVISIRQETAAFAPVGARPSIIESDKALIHTMARAIVHAADSGAKVIVASLPQCFPARRPVDQSQLGAAIRYAAVDKDAVVVASAGNVGAECGHNPDEDQPGSAQDPRNWNGVNLISTPGWFDDYVLTVGSPDDFSLMGPWVDVAAPASGITSISPEGALVDAYDNAPDAPNPLWGTSFSAAYVAGLAALIRSKHPELTAAQVIERITSTAKNPAGHVDNKLGHGMIDPLAAVGAVPQRAPEAPEPAHNTGLVIGATASLAVLVLGGGALWWRRRRA